MIVKPFKSLKNYGRTMWFHFKPFENPDKREQDFLRGRGEFGPSYAMMFDRHLEKLRQYPELEGLWYGRATVV